MSTIKELSETYAVAYVDGYNAAIKEMAIAFGDMKNMEFALFVAKKYINSKDK